MTDSLPDVGFRPYRGADHDAIAALWTRINRELAPPHLRERFEDYIAGALLGELKQVPQVFSQARRNAFWVVECGAALIGTFGIERRSDDATELRRMYLERNFRGRGVAPRMLRAAEEHARELGFSKMVLSTAEIQEAAIAFYRKSGYRLVGTEVADTMSTKTVGGGLTRLHFEKDL